MMFKCDFERCFFFFFFFLIFLKKCTYFQLIAYTRKRPNGAHSRIVEDKTKQFLNGPRREKSCLRDFANNTGADRPAHSRRLISAFVIRFLERIISKLATSEISIF